MLLIFLTLIAVWVAFTFFGGAESTPSSTITFLQGHLAGYRRWGADHPAAMPMIFAASLFLCALIGFPPPGIAIVGGGALLGLPTAFFIALPTAALGALIPFYAARYFLLARVVGWFPESHTKFQAGIKDDIEFYLFSLRLLPLVPFPLINIFMGITEISPLRFFQITLVGRIPLTFLYCSAGLAISELHSLSDIFSPSVSAVLLALAVLPHVARYFLKTKDDTR